MIKWLKCNKCGAEYSHLINPETGIVDFNNNRTDGICQDCYDKNKDEGKRQEEIKMNKNFNEVD